MYKILFFIVLTSGILFFLNSCNKAANPTEFSFTVDGNAVTVDSSYALLYTYSGSTVRRQIQIIGYSGGKQVIEILALPKLGAQPVLTDCFITYFYNGGYNSSDVYTADQGGVNFSNCDTSENLIQGTFSVENAINSDSTVKVITNGKIYFDIINR